MANIFKQQKDVNENPKRNNFDLSFQNHLTMKMGTLYPVFCKEVVPGDSFRINSAFGLKFMPLAFPVQSKMRANMHFFYVRNKNLWNRWEDWIQGLKGTADGVVHPYISQSADFFKTGTLADYLNVPTTYAVAGDTFFPIPSYYSILSPQLSNGFMTYYAMNPYVPQDSLQNGAGIPASAFFFFNDGIESTGTWDLFQEPAGSSAAAYIGTLYGWTNHLISDSNVEIAGYYEGTLSAVDFNVAIFTRPMGDTTQSHWSIRTHDIVSVDYINGVYKFALDADFISAWNGFVEEGLQCAFCIYSPLSGEGIPEFISDKDSSVITTGYFAPSIMMKVSTSNIEQSNYLTPFSSSADAIRISALPFRAYESICEAFYRNRVIQQFRVNGEIEYNRYNTNLDGGADTTPYHLYQRNYELDFLTSALPSPQQGNAPLVGMSALGTITLESEDGITTAKAVLDNDGNITGVNVTSPIASHEHALTLAQIASAGFSINDFRNTNALQRWLETNIRKGYRYMDFIAGHFGKSPKYNVLDMPEFIGGFSRDVTVSQIISSSDTLGIDGPNSGANLGSYGGNANCFGQSNHSITHYCDDYGFIVGILCVTPTPSYSQLLPKHFLKFNPLDYYFKEFSQLGMQPISYEEVCPVQAYNLSIADAGETSVTDTFGYQRPNYDLVASVDEIHGQFRSTLHNFLINRVFGSRPELSSDFLEIDSVETNQIFIDQAPNAENIIGQVVFDVKAKRPIPRVVIPNLGK